VSRAACVTSEAPGGISNHHNRVDSLMRPYVASNVERTDDDDDDDDDGETSGLGEQG